MDGLIVPTFVSEDDRVIVVSCNAREGCPLESCNCTKMQSYALLSARTLLGPIRILSLEGLFVDAKLMGLLEIIGAKTRISAMITMPISLFDIPFAP